MLDVAAFLLEFALQGHEAAADVPTCYVHPPLPPDDLKALGVPYLAVDADGHAALVQPVFSAPGADGGPEGGGAPSSSLDLLDSGGVGGSSSSSSSVLQQPKPLQAELEGPAVTTYFFNRWMWTQFPLVAVANCAAAAADAAGAMTRLPSSSSSASLPPPTQPSPLPDAPASPPRFNKALPASLVKIATLPLPALVVRRPTRPREGLVGLVEEGSGAPVGGPAMGDKEQVSACVCGVQGVAMSGQAMTHPHHATLGVERDGAHGGGATGGHPAVPAGARRAGAAARGV